jgi:hypothetical protein
MIDVKNFKMEDLEKKKEAKFSLSKVFHLKSKPPKPKKPTKPKPKPRPQPPKMY